MSRRLAPATLRTLRSLRARLRALDGSAGGGREAGRAVALGAAEVDKALPWGGLPRGALHEIAPWDTSWDANPVAAEGFAAALATRLIAGRGPLLWCLARGDLHGPGLAAFGLAPDRLIVARLRHPRDVPWAMEEGLRSGAPGAVIGEVQRLDLTASRRLQLAARAGGVACLALRPATVADTPGAAVTRWRVAGAPSLARIYGSVSPPPGLGETRWRVALTRCRGGVPCEWLLEWNDETYHFAVVPVLGKRADRAA